MTDTDKTQDDLLTLLASEFPFFCDYNVTHPAGLATIPDHRLGTGVAVIGAVVGEIVAAYELMRIGPKPGRCGSAGGYVRNRCRATPSTMIELGSEKHFARTADHLPAIFGDLAAIWTEALDGGAPSFQMHDVIRVCNTAETERIWNGLVHDLDSQSVYGFLAAQPLSRSAASASKHRARLIQCDPVRSHGPRDISS